MSFLNIIGLLLIIIIQTVYCYLPYNSRSAAHIVPFSSHGYQPSKYISPPAIADDTGALNMDDGEIGE